MSDAPMPAHSIEWLNNRLAQWEEKEKERQVTETLKEFTATDPGPGRKDDSGKLRMDLITPEMLEALGQVLTFGAKKYAPNNWQNVADAGNRYYGALLRHLTAWRAGEGCDPESGMPHLFHALTCAAFLAHLYQDIPLGQRQTERGKE